MGLALAFGLGVSLIIFVLYASPTAPVGTTQDVTFGDNPGELSASSEPASVVPEPSSIVLMSLALLSLPVYYALNRCQPVALSWISLLWPLPRPELAALLGF